MNPVTLSELRANTSLADLPDELLQWILDHSEYAEYPDGTLIMKAGDEINDMWILVEGKASFYMDVNGRLVYYFLFDNDEQSGVIGGLLPCSRLKRVGGSSFAVGNVRRLALHKQYFQELEALSPL